jgi:hypothetical protein
MLECHCENFHPNFQANVMLLDIADAQKLYSYFLQSGYISYEDWPEVHAFIERLRKFIS